MTDHLRAAKWLLVYVLVCTSPLTLNLIDIPPGRGFVINFSVAQGFVGLTIMGFQFILAARTHRVSAPFGMDVILQFHREMSYVAFIFVLAHPVVLVFTDSRFLSLFNLASDTTRAKFGIASVILLLLLMASSVWRQRLRIRYETWQMFHSLLAAGVVVTALVHLLLVSYYVDRLWKTLLWVVVSASFIALGAWVRVVQPLRRRRRHWIVEGVRHELGNCTTITLRPAESGAYGPNGFEFSPGQFAWIVVRRSPFALTYHPFSIASSAEVTETISFTIKGGGKFTDTIATLQPGESVYLDGPFGAFSLDKHEGPGFVFIAGGVGITPVLSMMRTLADREDPRKCFLFAGNQDESQITCREEIESLKDRLDLEVVHVLTQPGPGWTGESGRIDAAVLDRHLPARRSRLQYFVCGPAGMMDAVEESLRALDVRPERIHSERFAMV